MGRLRLSGHKAVIEDVLELLPDFHIGLAGDAHFAVEGEDTSSIRGVHHDVGIEARWQESTHVGEADWHTASIVGETQGAEGLHFAVGIVHELSGCDCLGRR